MKWKDLASGTWNLPDDADDAKRRRTFYFIISITQLTLSTFVELLKEIKPLLRLVQFRLWDLSNHFHDLARP